MQKYALLRERVASSGIVAPAALAIPEPASDADLGRAHNAHYLARVQAGALTAQEVRRIGFPWSPGMVERSRRSSGATMAACRAALRDGFAANLAGGTHHAYADHGEGYCVFNDSAVAARAMQAEGRVRRVVIIDCDVHQGNGTAAILAGDPTIYTFSIHGAKNFPFHKETSDLDLALEDGAGDTEYLAALDAGLCQALEESQAELAIYLAGSDPFEDDKLGRLKVSKAGLAARDRMVLEYCRGAGLPVAITMAGGYARNVADTVDIHFETVRQACALSAG
ncbi:deacetylase [Kouleothrix aurantiaca]|uniref:Deacetylase n=1 Tax=Kouleothrix aurantiaca TaxID=186479 RepID=A0A0N8PRI1_9CHLR|nr:deacetylase [Kouleothrix aurantiaca]